MRVDVTVDTPMPSPTNRMTLFFCAEAGGAATSRNAAVERAPNDAARLLRAPRIDTKRLSVAELPVFMPTSL